MTIRINALVPVYINVILAPWEGVGVGKSTGTEAVQGVVTVFNSQPGQTTSSGSVLKIWQSSSSAIFVTEFILLQLPVDLELKYRVTYEVPLW